MMYCSGDLGVAMRVAYNAHEGQLSKKTAIPYILHPIDVMTSMMKAGWGEEFYIVALLHDVVEDTDVDLRTLELLGFRPDIICAVEALTNDHRGPRDEYLDGVCENLIAFIVKYYDARDNLRRSLTLSDDDEDRDRLVKKYEHTIEYLDAYSPVGEWLPWMQKNGGVS